MSDEPYDQRTSVYLHDVPGRLSTERLMVERIMLELKLDNVNDFRLRDRLIASCRGEIAVEREYHNAQLAAANAKVGELELEYLRLLDCITGTIIGLRQRGRSEAANEIENNIRQALTPERT